jgi:hypothetical protein
MSIEANNKIVGDLGPDVSRNLLSAVKNTTRFETFSMPKQSPDRLIKRVNNNKNRSSSPISSSSTTTTRRQGRNRRGLNNYPNNIFRDDTVSLMSSLEANSLNSQKNRNIPFERLRDLTHRDTDHHHSHSEDDPETPMTFHISNAVLKSHDNTLVDASYTIPNKTKESEIQTKLLIKLD